MCLLGDGTPEELLSFLEEALIMKDFKHDHVLPLYGVVIDFNKPYVVLPYMENGDLRDYVRETSRVLFYESLLPIKTDNQTNVAWLRHISLFVRLIMVPKCKI